MRFSVRVVPNAKKGKIIKGNNNLKVYLTVPATCGRANKALVEILAGYFDVAKSKVKIIKGEKSHNKIVEVL